MNIIHTGFVELSQPAISKRQISQHRMCHDMPAKRMKFGDDDAMMNGLIEEPYGCQNQHAAFKTLFRELQVIDHLPAFKTKFNGFHKNVVILDSLDIPHFIICLTGLGSSFSFPTHYGTTHADLVDMALKVNRVISQLGVQEALRLKIKFQQLVVDHT